MTETPKYTVENKDEDVEIRVYPGYILAQVDVESDYDKAIGLGFRILANYIVGGNKKRSNIPMTAPVSGENISVSEKIPMTVPVTEEALHSEKIEMTAPVSEEAVDEPEKIEMAVPVTEEDSEIIDLPILNFGISKTKKEVLEELQKGETSVKNLAVKIGISRGMTYNHIRELREMGFIAQDKLEITSAGELAVI